MSSNVMPGRFRDTIQILTKGSGSDDWGTPKPASDLIKLKSNVVVRSGDQNSSYGVLLDSEVITCLCFYRDVVKSGQLLKWLGRGGERVYEIKHVKPADNRFKSMIITAELRPNG